MASSQLDLRLNSIQGRTIAAKAKLPVKNPDGLPQATGKNLDEAAKTIGNVFAVALRHAGLTQQEASYRMGYADASKLARWISGDEVASIVTRFLSVPELRRGFLIALAELKGTNVQIQTVVTIGHGEREAV